MRIRTLALTAFAVSGLVIGAAGQAGAATGGVLTVGSAGGTNVNVGDVLTGPISSDFLFTTSSGTIDCSTGAFSASATANGSAPGTATESITQLHADPANCSSTIGGTTSVVSVELNGDATGIVTDGASPTLAVTGLDEQVTLGTILGGNVTCDYGNNASGDAAINGSLTNGNNGISFATQNVALLSGSGLCPSSGTFAGAVGPITDTTQSAGLVFVN
ncbi:Tat pathway signal sequence domain protein [Catenulispora pinisilvae]|uniref:Tat pathway signal sequence domain protein n=1 Tax=Catenulispora pinisilvae TaxID=2705253 RepID=UPI0018926A33|nr:Tat pathway signal sequence domain protein [Catenulispora pinisilvae]